MVTSKANSKAGVSIGCAVAALLFVLVGTISWTESRRQLAETKHRQESLLNDEGTAPDAAKWRVPAAAPFGVGAVKAFIRAIDLRRRAALEKHNINLPRAESVSSSVIWLITFALVLGVIGIYFLLRRVDRGLKRAAYGFSTGVERMAAASRQGSRAEQTLA